MGERITLKVGGIGIEQAYILIPVPFTTSDPFDQAGSQTWGPFNHDEEGWLHEMLTLPVIDDAMQVNFSIVLVFNRRRQTIEGGNSTAAILNQVDRPNIFCEQY